MECKWNVHLSNHFVWRGRRRRRHYPPPADINLYYYPNDNHSRISIAVFPARDDIAQWITHSKRSDAVPLRLSICSWPTLEAQREQQRIDRARWWRWWAWEECALLLQSPRICFELTDKSRHFLLLRFVSLCDTSSTHTNHQYGECHEQCIL